MTHEERKTRLIYHDTISKAPVSSLLFLPLSLPPNSLLFSISVFLFSFPHSPHLFFSTLLFLRENIMEIIKLKWWPLIKVEIFTSIDLHLYYHLFWFPSLLTAILETLITMNKEEEERMFCKNEDEPEMVAHTCNLGSREGRGRRITTSRRSAWSGMMFCTLFKTTLSQLKLLQL